MGFDNRAAKSRIPYSERGAHKGRAVPSISESRGPQRTSQQGGAKRPIRGAGNGARTTTMRSDAHRREGLGARSA
ncbi:hypothetical protein Sm713_13750 [Streptomyces sp. TS71-3]|nr:hypothetical protein Sm713_13750 [Streptomyces sp. TS71-3]